MFERLFSPLDMGPITIKNRIQVTPHELNYLQEGLPTETLAYYYAERARGGAGLLELSQIMTRLPFGAWLFPDWKYDSARRFPFVNGPEIVPGLRILAERVHEHGAKIFMQVAAWTWINGPVSAVPLETGVQLNELTLPEIREIQEGFGAASKIVKEAGFDGIDLHGTHASLIEHFYSPIMNRRSDQYGGTLENRLRFLVEVVDLVRGTVGASMAVGMRLCGDERIEGGVTPDYAAKIAGLMDGKLDFLNVGSGSAPHFEALNQMALQSPPLYVESGHGVYMAEAVKAAVAKTRVGISGRILDPVKAEEILRKGQADYIGMTRALIADPELPKKAMAARLQEIRPCIGTLQDCWGRAVAHEWPMRCTVNPAVGREKERGAGVLGTAGVSKNVLIIGSGPAGLESARVASERGHRVVIYEKEGAIGGQVKLAKMLPGRNDIGAIAGWYEFQLRMNGVRIELRKEVTPEPEVIQFLVEEERPDAVILATGSRPIESGLQMITFREVPGWDRPNVQTVDEVLERGEGLRGRVVVADSTTFIEGPGIAEWLASRGARVTLVTPHSRISPELSDYNQHVHVIRRLFEARVRTVAYSWIRRIEEGRVLLYHIPTGSEEELEAESVVLNTGRQQNKGLKALFAGLVKEVYEIGDCSMAGGRIRNAIEDGYSVAASL